MRHEQRLNRRQFLLASGAGFAALAGRLPGLPAAPAADRPNIVFILADDIGYGDLGCYGATKVKTPNLDRLATQGIRFTDAHSSSAMCSPTRYAVMTGEYAWRNPATTVFVLDGEAPLCIRPGRMTLPSMLKQAGYTTGVVGKWHLGLGEGKTNYNAEIQPGPREVGFDYDFIFPATGDRVPCVFIEDRRVVGLDPNDPIAVDYTVKARSPEMAVNGITRVGKMTGGAAAIWKDEQMAETLTKKAVAFLEQHKDERFFLYFPTHNIHLPRVPAPRFRGTSQAGVRGDVIQELDWSVGEVMATLDRLNLTNNTTRSTARCAA
ncbi:MAG: sulfatase-like hydrolase/transferase [Candidatus Sumerlaeota bacterium]|nr:sulfatase-like hydrolase/transferase [Candidatus Sumerlaeota bacterium]